MQDFNPVVQRAFGTLQERSAHGKSSIILRYIRLKKGQRKKKKNLQYIQEVQKKKGEKARSHKGRKQQLISRQAYRQYNMPSSIFPRSLTNLKGLARIIKPWYFYVYDSSVRHCFHKRRKSCKLFVCFFFSLCDYVLYVCIKVRRKEQQRYRNNALEHEYLDTSSLASSRKTKLVYIKVRVDETRHTCVQDFFFLTGVPRHAHTYTYRFLCDTKSHARCIIITTIYHSIQQTSEKLYLNKCLVKKKKKVLARCRKRDKKQRRAIYVYMN